MTEPISGRENDNQRQLGFLLEPLGWVQSYLGKMIEAEPTLATPLLALEHWLIAAGKLRPTSYWCFSKGQRKRFLISVSIITLLASIGCCINCRQKC